MDLSTLDSVKAANDGAEMILKHPVTSVPMDCAITLLGRDSAIFQAENNRQLNTSLLAGLATSTPAEDTFENTINLLARCTINWRNIEFEGKPLDYSPENAAMLYRRLPWLREQANAFVSTRANFMKA